MKIKNIDFLSKFLPAFNEVGNAKTGKTKLRYAIKKTIPEVDAAVSAYHAINKERLELMACKNEDGTIKLGADKSPVFPDAETDAKFMAELKELNELEIDLNVYQVSAEDLEGIEISAYVERDLGEFILDEPVLKTV